MNRKILVTGASGFIGRHLIRSLALEGWQVLAAARAVQKVPQLNGISAIHTASIDGQSDWRGVLRGTDSVVHLAGRVHVMQDGSADPMLDYRRVNVEATLNLARQAASARVRRFVFISSIKVNGEESIPGRPFRADDVPGPLDSYGRSKYEAEVGLRQIACETGIELVIIRPVMVYGPSVGANFLTMMKWLRAGIPLPFGGIRNRRSLVAVENLVSLIALCLNHQSAVDNIFLVSDGESCSTPDLLVRTASAMGKSARLLSLPESILRKSADWIGKAHVAQRLCGTLEVDITKTQEMLGWVPIVAMDEALRITVRAFLEARNV